jgi:L-rhamnose isomerase/sugar isomerase
MGVPRNPFEKLEDAAEVHRLTGLCPSVALHIPWDKVDSWDRLRGHASSLGLRLGAINPNVFQDDEYMLGSVCHHEPAVRRKATDHILECVQIMREAGSDILSCGLPMEPTIPARPTCESANDG